MNAHAVMLSALVLLLGRPALATEPFAPLSLEEARRQAGEQKKLVVALFTQTACESCVYMERGTFGDPRVEHWLSDHAVTVRIEAERAPEAVKQHDVVEFPTVLFVRPDGIVVDRFGGERDGQRFLQLATAVHEGRNSLAAAEAELKRAGSNDPNARLALARALIDHRRPVDALEHLLWCFDEGHRQTGPLGENFRLVRLTYLLNDFKRLARHYPPARDALVRRRDAARERVLAGKADKDETAEFTALNRTLGADDDTLSIFDQLRRAHPDSQTLAYLRLRVFGALLEQRRYADINDSFDVVVAAAAEFDRFETYGNFLRDPAIEAGSASQRATMRDLQRRVVAQKVCEYYEVLVAVERNDEAGKLAGRLLEFDKSAVVYQGLAAAGLRAGKPTHTHLDYARTGLEMSGGGDPESIGLVGQLMAHLGRRTEAIDFVKEKLDSVKDPGAKLRLQTLIDALRSEGREPQAASQPAG